MNVRHNNPGLIHSLAIAFPGALALYFLVGLRYFEPPWIQSAATQWFGVGFALAYMAGVLYIHFSARASERLVQKLLRAVVISCVISLPVLFVIILAKSPYRNLTIIQEFLALLFLVVITSIPARRMLVLSANSLLLFVGAFSSVNEFGLASLREALTTQHNSTLANVSYVFSSLHDTQITKNSISRWKDEVGGGGLSVLDEDRALLVSGTGAFFELNLSKNGLIKSDHLSNLVTPMNRSAFVEQTHHDNAKKWFRVTGTLLEKTNKSTKSLYVAHHSWNQKKDCITLDIWESLLDINELERPLTWKHRFSTSPCLPYANMYNVTGGRLAFGEGNTLLLSVGVTTADPKYADSASDPNSSYGKVLELDLDTGETSVFSSGHRNPQGLLYDGKFVWATEHGPRGGDELNLLQRGLNYGWPNSSYGTDYTSKVLTGSNSPGDHSKGERPMFAWVPSIGVSNLIRIQGDAFPSWRGDILVGSLSGRGNGYSLYRVKVHAGRLQVVERIHTGEKIRDLLEMPDGRVLLWNGMNAVQVVQPAAHTFSKCAGCHAVFYDQHGIAPDLMDIVNNRVARHSGFQYSAAMKKLGGRWSRERLDAFLKDPQMLVPGTSMAFPGIKERGERQAIIDYLAQLPQTAR